MEANVLQQSCLSVIASSVECIPSDHPVFAFNTEAADEHSKVFKLLCQMKCKVVLGFPGCHVIGLMEMS